MRPPPSPSCSGGYRYTANYGAAAATLAGSCLIGRLKIYLVGNAIKLGAREVIAITYRRVIGCLVLIGALLAVTRIWTIPRTAIGRAWCLVIIASFRDSIYFASAWALWGLPMDPESGETWILEKIDGLRCGMIERLRR